MQNKGYYAVQGQLPKFLLVINTNQHPISYRFEVIVDYLNFGHCVYEPPFGGLSNLHCSSYAHWKARIRIRVIMLIELFSLRVTAEALRMIDKKLITR